MFTKYGGNGGVLGLGDQRCLCKTWGFPGPFLAETLRTSRGLAGREAAEVKACAQTRGVRELIVFASLPGR